MTTWGIAAISSHYQRRKNPLGVKNINKNHLGIDNLRTSKIKAPGSKTQATRLKDEGGRQTESRNNEKILPVFST
jgi:hypothetical protein